MARQHWEELVETYGHISKILDMLLQEAGPASSLDLGQRVGFSAA